MPQGTRIPVFLFALFTLAFGCTEAPRQPHDTGLQADISADAHSDIQDNVPSDAGHDGPMDATVDAGSETTEIPDGVITDGVITDGIKQDPLPGSQYLEPVTLPACDTSNPKVFLISKAADWKHINDTAYRVFCVKPGDYRSIGNISLTVSGTKNAPRVIRHAAADTGATSHPATMSVSEQAIVRGFQFNVASYWVIDRLSTSGPASPAVVRMSTGSTHNILNRMRIEDMGYGVRMVTGADYNVVQRCLIGNMRIHKGTDATCIENAGDHVRGTKVIQNEIYNCNDGIHLVGPKAGGRSYPDTILAGNQIYLTNTLYSDCKGNRSPSGDCACAENAFDIKVGSKEKAHPVLITENIMWGYRRTDTLCGGSGDVGTLGVAHFDVQNLIISKNVFYDSPRGVTIADCGLAICSDITFEGNTFHSMRKNAVDKYSGSALFIYADRVRLENNLFVRNTSSVRRLGGMNGTLLHNVFISNGPGGTIDPTTNADYNRYYDTPQLGVKGPHDDVQASAAKSGFTPHCFDVRPWTKPGTLCLDFVKPPTP
ncbi:MAG: right-handed parallel beta-helix repeat-containing protein [Deltaproteobacteria bacterium]|nr:right-handed parallel beta-helix repeat-containing protein [Deltaproteobacteria bacterium]